MRLQLASNHMSRREQVAVSSCPALTATERSPVELTGPKGLHGDEMEEVLVEERTVHSYCPSHHVFDSLAVDQEEVRMFLMPLLASCSNPVEVRGEGCNVPWSW